MTMFTSMIVAGVGGFFGTCGRYLTGVLAKRLFGSRYPAGTLAVNVIGCYLIGIFFGLWTRAEIDPLVKALLITGFCGGYTTFSSFSHDMVSLLQQRRYLTFVLYLVPSVALGLLMVWLGMLTV